MARRIRARTLTNLLGSYIGQFSDEAARLASDGGAEEGAELLGLLRSESAWLLLDRVEPKTAAAWVNQSSDPALRRLFAHSTATQLARVWRAMDASLQTRVATLVDPATAAHLPGR
jgi:hypothetical protein